MRRGAWCHLALTGYLWLITFVPLGKWNAQPGPHLALTLLAGQRLQAGDVGFLVFVSLPAVVFWLAYWRRSFLLASGALFFDAFWTLMQVQSWWVPYVTGTTKAWQLEYAKGSTTKVLPSFGNHVAPDGMHLMISVLLVVAIVTGLMGVRELRQGRRLALLSV